MNKTNDDVMQELLKAKKEGLRIVYDNICIEENHAWDISNNTYSIIRPREYIICIPKKGKPYIEKLENRWTRSDFGKRENGDNYILMREVL